MTTAHTLETAESRARSSTPVLPRWQAVLVEQLRATGLVLRRPAQIAAALAVFASISIAIRIVSKDLSFDLNAEPSPMYGLVGALLPIAVWATDVRFGPGFLWTLPVDRRRLALTKVFAGWLWLMGGVALSVLWLVVIALASGGRVLPPETIHLLEAPFPLTHAMEPAALRAVIWAPSSLIGLVPFTAASATYLLGSALWIGSRHPLRWVIGMVLGFLLASFASHVGSEQLGLSWLTGAPESALKWLVEAPYGLDALLTAQTATLDTGGTLVSGERVSVWTAVPEMAHWGGATLLWTAGGLIALWAAASRHGEQRRA